jgi:hypothetical protein
MGLNKSKKLVKKSVKEVAPEPVEEIEELDEIEEIEEEEIEEPAPKRATKSSAKAAPKAAAKPAKAAKTSAPEAVEIEDAEDEDDDAGLNFDAGAVVRGIVSHREVLTSAVYQIQLRLPADIEPMYKQLSPRLKKALRDAFADLVRKAYEQTH